MKNNTFTARIYWFDIQNYFVFLVITFKDLWFYSYYEVTKNLFVYKYDEGQQKVIFENTYIYHLVYYNQCVRLLHCNNIYYKAMIKKKKW